MSEEIEVGGYSSRKSSHQIKERISPGKGTGFVSGEDISKETHRLLLGAVKERIRAAQLRAPRQVNSELVRYTSDVARLICRTARGRTWGKSILTGLAQDLQAEFFGTNGFLPLSHGNEAFYKAYGQDETRTAGARNRLVVQRRDS